MGSDFGAVLFWETVENNHIGFRIIKIGQAESWHHHATASTHSEGRMLQAVGRVSNQKDSPRAYECAKLARSPDHF